MAKQNKGRKFFAASATAALVASAIVPVASAAQVNDLNKVSGYAKEAVQNLVDNGVIQGDQNGNFNPLNTISRAEAAEIFAKALNLTASGDVNFKDVKSDAWYYNSITAVVEQGIFEGVSTTEFAPSKNLTRSEAAKILVEAFGFEGEADVDGFADASQIKPWAKQYLEIAVANGIFEGTDANRLNPNNSITRQDFALTFQRALNLVDNEIPEEAAFVKAINNTTVEVTLSEEVSNVQALDFAIEGLEIKNASVKQTDKKVVVLTTAPQTAEKEYVVTLDGEAIGGFKGIAAVVPTKVELVSSSVQGKLGQEVKLQAKVSVGEGQSKAGIPVTFNIPGDNNDAVVPTIVGEAVTNEEGIATYSYTRYKEGRDDITAYATGDRSKFAYGYVFWGVDTILSIEEVTTGATINNGANKTYKITYKNDKTGKPEAGKTFNVGFIENIDVTSDKVANATVNGVKALQLSNGTVLDAAQITTDSKGEATFTVSGTNAAVTPVVYDLHDTKNNTSNKKYAASALQASAAKVTFAAVQADYTLELTREGGEVAAIGATNGREYKVIVKDKEGKVAKNEVVNVAFNETLDRVISTNTDAQFIKDKKYVGTTTTVKTDDKGEAKFVIGSDTENAYATPIAWIDINTSNAKNGQLDEGEPKAVAPISYFQKAYLDGASIKSYAENGPYDDDNIVTKFKGTEKAAFRADLVNQSGKTMPGTTIKSVTYTVFNTGANDIKVKDQVISPNRSYTFTDNNTLFVESIDNKTTSVKVIATGVAVNTDGKDFQFTAKEAAATFTSTTAVDKEITERVAAIDKENIEFAGKEAIKIKEGAKFFGGNGAELIGFDAFLAELTSATYNNGVVVTYLEDADGKQSFKVVRATTGGAVNATTTLTTAKITQAAVVTQAATPATATITAAALNNQSLTVNNRTFTHNPGASASDTTTYVDVADLITKINNAGGDVTATADTAGLVLTGKSDGTNFTYQIASLAAVTTTNGVPATTATKQQLTFTFSTAVDVKAGAAVTVTIAGTPIDGTVANVDANKVVVTLDNPAAVGAAVTAFNVGTTPLKAKLTKINVNFATTPPVTVTN